MAANLGYGHLFSLIVRHIPGGDKTCHFLLLGSFSASLHHFLHYSRLSMGKASLPKGPFLLALAITLEEFSQFFNPNRGFDWGDMGANILGILVFTIVQEIVHNWQIKP